MPIIAIIVVVIVGGVAAYFFMSQSSSTEIAPEPEAVVETTPTPTADTEDVVENTDISSEPTETIPSLNADPEPEPDPEPEVTTTTPEPEEPETTYADGTYTANVMYRVPQNHVDPLTLTLTIANDTITSATVAFDPTNGTSKKHQDRFSDAYESQVIGKAVDNVSLSRVGGASLTSRAFNDALADIKVDARS